MKFEWEFTQIKTRAVARLCGHWPEPCFDGCEPVQTQRLTATEPRDEFIQKMRYESSGLN
jgi:hypothetical protein